MGLSLKLGNINFNEYRVEIMAVLLLIAVGYAVWAKYKSLKFGSG